MIRLDPDGTVLVRTTEVNKILIEEFTPTITYEGRALTHDARTDLPVWQIRRVAVSGALTTITYANDAAYDQVWDNRSQIFGDSSTFVNTQSLEFNGVNEYVDLGDNYTFGPATAFTWSLWLKAQNFAAHRRFISKTTQDTNVYGYNFGHTNAGKLWTQVRAPGTLLAHTFNTVLTAGTWYHVAFTYAGGSNMAGLKAYVNGVEEDPVSSSALNAWTVPDPLTFGNRGNTMYFSGLLNNISVWNKALSQSEISALYNAGVPGDLTNHSDSENLLSWWHLNSGDSAPLEVDHVNDVNGTLQNLDENDYVVDAP